MDVTLRLRVTGRVQGVGYRHSLLGQAMAAGLRGWVRNRRDGTVEAVLQGERAAVDAVVNWSRRGPPAARVEGVEVEELATAEPCMGFEQRPTG